MLKVRFFFTDPPGDVCRYYAQMIPRLAQKYNIEIETISKKPTEYRTDEYFELNLPIAPAVMVGEEIVSEGNKIGGYKIESVICRHLGLPAPKIDLKALYEFFYAILARVNRYRKRWTARNLGT